MGELRIDCVRCGIEFDVTADRIKGVKVKRSEVAMALLGALGINDMPDYRIEYRIYCPKCNRGIAKFSSMAMDI